VVSDGEPAVPHPELPQRAFWRRLIADIDADVAAQLDGPAADQMGSRSAS
jgi:hypothetical protein